MHDVPMAAALVRPGRPGDGAGCARVWLETARYYVGLGPAGFRVPAAGPAHRGRGLGRGGRSDRHGVIYRKSLERTDS
jgi:hypothetical protein